MISDNAANVARTTSNFLLPSGQGAQEKLDLPLACLGFDCAHPESIKRVVFARVIVYLSVAISRIFRIPLD